MSLQHLCHHRSCSNRVQPKVPLTKPPHCGRPRLLSSPFILSSRCCSQRAARLAATQCSSSPDGPQRVSDQSPADETLPAPLPSSRVLLAVGSIGLAVVTFVASRSLLGRPALDELKLQSMPLHSALANGRPTVLEFYADWCEVCGELAPTALQVRPETFAVSWYWHTRRHTCSSNRWESKPLYLSLPLFMAVTEDAWLSPQYVRCADQAGVQRQGQLCHAEH